MCGAQNNECRGRFFIGFILCDVALFGDLGIISQLEI